MTDIAFTHDNRPLAELLLQVVGRDAAARSQALEVLQAWQLGVASTDTDLDDCDEDEMNRQRARFKAEVERTVLDPAFPGADYVRGLAALILGKHAEWMLRMKRADDRFDKLLDRYLQEPSSKQDKRHLRKEICAETPNDLAAHDALMDGVNAAVLFESLGAAILLAPDAVRMLLDDDSNKYVACDALAAAGPQAAPEFLADLLAIKSPEFDSSVLAALIAVGGNDPRVAKYVDLA
jgi:hypothetical protein